jgi:hypothetical protein
MVWFFDKLNRPSIMVALLVLSLVVTSFLYYRYAAKINAAQSPPAASGTKALSSESSEGESQANETEEQDDSPSGENNDVVAQGSEQSEAPYLPAQSQETASPVPVADSSSVIPPDLPTPTYSEPVPDKNSEADLLKPAPTFQAYQYADSYQYGDVQF